MELLLHLQRPYSVCDAFRSSAAIFFRLRNHPRNICASMPCNLLHAPHLRIRIAIPMLGPPNGLLDKEPPCEGILGHIPWKRHPLSNSIAKEILCPDSVCEENRRQTPLMKNSVRQAPSVKQTWTRLHVIESRTPLSVANNEIIRQTPLMNPLSDTISKDILCQTQCMKNPPVRSGRFSRSRRFQMLLDA